MYGAVENTALAIWKAQGKPGDKKNQVLLLATSMSTDLRWMFNLLTRKLRREFGNLTKGERKRPATKKATDALR